MDTDQPASIVARAVPVGTTGRGTELPVLDLVYLLGSVLLFVALGALGKVLARL